MTQHRGIVRQYDYNDTVEGVVDLIKRLAHGDIQGFLISIPTYYYYAYQIKHNDTYRHLMETIKGKTTCDHLMHVSNFNFTRSTSTSHTHPALLT